MEILVFCFVYLSYIRVDMGMGSGLGRDMVISYIDIIGFYFSFIISL